MANDYFQLNIIIDCVEIQMIRIDVYIIADDLFAAPYVYTKRNMAVLIIEYTNYYNVQQQNQINIFNSHSIASTFICGAMVTIGWIS